MTYTYIVHITAGEEQRLDKIIADKAILDPMAKLFVVFDACEEDLPEKYRKLDRFVNSKNPWRFAKSINMAIKALNSSSNTKDTDFCILPAEFNKPISSPEDLYLGEKTYQISNKVYSKLGGLDNLFIQQMYLIDYAHRAKIAGFSVYVDSDIIKKEIGIDGEPTFDTLKFGTKWDIPDSIPIQDFWKYCQESKYDWKEEMSVCR